MCACVGLFVWLSTMRSQCFVHRAPGTHSSRSAACRFGGSLNHHMAPLSNVLSVIGPPSGQMGGMPTEESCVQRGLGTVAASHCQLASVVIDAWRAQWPDNNLTAAAGHVPRCSQMGLDLPSLRCTPACLLAVSSDLKSNVMTHRSAFSVARWCSLVAPGESRISIGRVA